MTATIINFATRLGASAEHSRAERPAKAGRRNADIGPDGEIMKPTKKRRWNFARAEMYLQFLNARREVENCGHMLFDRYAIPECASYHSQTADDHWAWAEKIGAAKIALLLTPVSCRAELYLKRSILARGTCASEKERAAIDGVMQADEAYLAIPRQHRNAALSGKAVRS
jgi:hypothetical protein